MAINSSHTTTSEKTLDRSEQFWRREFKDFSATIYPVVSSLYKPSTLKILTENIDLACGELDPVSAGAALALAWGLVLSRYTGNDDVIFGLGLESKSNDFSDTPVLPLRLLVDPQQSAMEALNNTETKIMDRSTFGVSSTRELSELGGEIAAGCQFMNILNIRQGQQNHPNALQSNEAHNVPLVIHCEIRTNGVDVEALVDPSTIPVETTRMMLHQLGHSFRATLNRRSRDTLVGDLRSVCPQGLADLMERGVQPPSPLVHARVHDLVVAQCQSSPLAPAIAAWDGHLTYHELDQFSSRLATKLAKLKLIQPDKIVPVLMERSVWVSVAILGILKAGGAFLLMDVSFTDDHVKQICAKIQPPLVLTSGRQEDRARSLDTPFLVVGDKALSADDEGNGTYLQSDYVQPSDACHGLFTSGSSGDPKIVVIDHAAVCTAWAQPTATQLTLSSSSRVLQSGSHAFAPDLGPGNDAVEAIQKFNANFITLTPSASRLLDPNQVPSLQVVVLAGEALGPLDLEKWQGRVQLKCMYGLAETAAFSLLADLTTPNSNYREIGVPTHTWNCWIVDTNNVEDLVPPGGVGELLLEGPSLGRGYLDDPARTAQTFIPTPSWLMQIRPVASHDSRCLKTGDLVRYSPSGTIEYIRRKDVTEVKIRGQRMDLTDVERHLARQYPTATRVAVDVIIPSDDVCHNRTMLVGFVYTEPPQHGVENENDEIFARSTIESREKVATVLSTLKEVLPTFMVPDVVVTVNRIPMTTSGKLHRDRLRRLASALPRRALLAHGNIPFSETDRHSERLVE
ncbi:Nonribosomal peptide synthase, putative [Penicillium digitatum]|uniref:Nonribosomal peptide synthase, putative n=1 Tax=Penicillium digitatum TaxID=36651 RepID=A0A7T6XRW7_PENDI|nr:Nonribosomal peptide synthase, putative [Penicillium digitatum]